MENLEDWMLAGKIAGQARDYGATLVKKGASILEVVQKIDAKIKELGGQNAFPVNVSMDATAAHDTAFPADERLFGKNVVKVDVGVHVNGAIGDTAITVDLTGEHAKLLKASRDALDAALELVRPGVEIGKIGSAIQEAITSHGFAPIRNLSGHGLSLYEVHDNPSIPNTNTRNTDTLQEGKVIAIEPFATNGNGLIQEAGLPAIYSQVSERPVRDRIARQVLVEIKKYQNLPFSTLNLTNKFSAPQARFGLLQLKRAGVVRDYPPLVEIGKGLVSQAEHTIMILDEPIVTTRV